MFCSNSLHSQSSITNQKYPIRFCLYEKHYAIVNDFGLSEVMFIFQRAYCKHDCSVMRSIVTHKTI